jgi:hypothetical protein
MRPCSVRSVYHSHERVIKVQHFAENADSCEPASPKLDRATLGAGVSKRYRRSASIARSWAPRMALSATALLLLLAAAPVRGQEIWFGPRTPDCSVTPVRDWDLLWCMSALPGGAPLGRRVSGSERRPACRVRSSG